ncbi:MAG TPA: S26 family signal peptidase, partial [Pirellulaceae bacterium]|nr:S26 family signal peptidase [Pirellulaceae bacterium]
LLWREARRGEVIAAHEPGSTAEFLTKRVAALPGEEWGIRGGDLYADGEIVRKSLHDLREVRVLVHDNAFQPRLAKGLPPRWQPADGNSRWKASSFGFAADGNADDSAAFDWLQYHHWRCTESSAPRAQSVPILDNDSYNQNLSRQLNPVRDVLLACTVRTSGEGQLAFAAMDGSRRWEARLDLGQRQMTLLDSGQPVLEKPFTVRFDRRAIPIEFGLCDGQVLLSVAGRIVVVWPYKLAKTEPPDVLDPLAIGAKSLDVQVTDLKIWRDIYYLAPFGTASRWQADQPLAAGEFALLGDNPPASEDSREWPGSGGISRSEFLGVVMRPFWARSRSLP